METVSRNQQLTLKDMKQIWPYLLCVVFDLLLLFGAWELGRHCGRKETRGQVVGVEVRTETDTVVRRDTITVRKPQPYRERVLPVDMTIGEADSLFALATADTLPLKVQREYRDSSYTAWVSGYDPQLDSVKVFPRTVVISTEKTITQTVAKRNRFSWGLTVGAGYGITTRKPDVFVGVGMTWRP